jgi:secondary thiamine-phosphate synthase enzyme
VTVFQIKTSQRNEMLSVTSLLCQFIRDEKIDSGSVLAFVPHTTAGITINENADPDVVRDILFGLEKISPNLREFLHGEGNSDAHIKSSLIGVSLIIPVEGQKPVLGTWQGVFFCEFDGPRMRKLILKKG